MASSGHDIVVIGASAGGIQALRMLVPLLPPRLNASIFVVVHLPAESPGMLGQILDWAGSLPAETASDGGTIEPGHIYVAPPDHHLVLEQDRVRVLHGPRQNRHRPAIDPLFRSAAAAYGPRVVGILLSGTSTDGLEGLRVVRQGGGVAVVQDPEEAAYPDLPAAALARMKVDHVLELREIAALVIELAGEPAAVHGRPAERSATGGEEPMQGHGEEGEAVGEGRDIEVPGRASVLTCPDCGGVLWEIEDGEALHYQCHVGHMFSPDALVSGQSDGIEEALYVTLRRIKEKAAFLRHLSVRYRDDLPDLAHLYEAQADKLELKANVVRGLLGHESAG